jgi:hypothetical protein
VIDILGSASPIFPKEQLRQATQRYRTDENCQTDCAPAICTERNDADTLPQPNSTIWSTVQSQAQTQFPSLAAAVGRERRSHEECHLMFPANIWIKSSECPAFSAPVQFVFFYSGDQRRHRQPRSHYCWAELDVVLMGPLAMFQHVRPLPPSLGCLAASKSTQVEGANIAMNHRRATRLGARCLALH